MILVAGPLKVTAERKKMLTYVRVKIKMVHFLSFLKISNARISHERGARLRHIGPIGLRPALTGESIDLSCHDCKETNVR